VIPARSPSPAAGKPFRVLVVDDSAIVRGMMARWLGEAADFEVVGAATDGAQAVKKAAEVDAELCVLDVEMPVMNGLEALPQLLRARPGLRVVMASTLTVKGGEVALRALDLGAADYIAKPQASGLGGATAYRDELLDKLRRLGEAGRRRPMLVARPTAVVPSAAPAAPAIAPPPSRRSAPSLTVIASSTGGPPALAKVLSGLGPGWPTPIMIVQHMPSTFTRVLADHLCKQAGVETCEAAAGQVMQAGRAYVAPGDWHMTVALEAGRPVVRLDQNAPENWCRPAADPLFRSAASVYRDRVLAIVLTGMGADGREGARALAAQGAYVIAQDEATSVVWGMPGAVVGAGAAHAVKPLDRVAEAAWSLVRGSAHAS
jgi:two-component system chemotaxis response regulator CheB